MINFYFAKFVKLVLAFLLASLQAGTTIAAAHSSMITVGDEIDGMRLTRGAADARPLWVFCASEVNKNVTTANCRVPKMQKLAIGHIFVGTDELFREVQWSDLKWELYIDDQLIDLNDFGSYEYVLPTMAPSPSLVREVFMKFTAWDIVLTDLQPGEHIMEGRVRADGEEYKWKVNLLIEDRTISSEKKDSREVQSGCSLNFQSLSPFQHSCRFYG